MRTICYCAVHRSGRLGSLTLSYLSYPERVLDSIWEGYRFTIAEVVADNTSGGGFLLGKQPLGEPLTGRLSLFLNGELLTEGPVEALGDIGASLSWLSEQVGGLRTGQVIFLGSPAAALPARPSRLELHGPQESVLSALIEE
jgi:2-keto-4-pentenoate hydratase